MKKPIYTIIVIALTVLNFSANAQIISTYAGDAPSAGTYSGDGGAATSAGLRQPAGTAIDAAGNLYIADRDNHVIRKVNTAGIISTIAGNNTSGASGDGGAATSAQLSQPVGLNFDASGNMYIADYGNHRIRMINATGIISTVAGTVSGYSGDGGAATSARLSYPTDVAFDAAGNMYISDYNYGLIRKVTTAGIISTFAGGGSSYADGIPATNASFYATNGVRVDQAGNVYVTDMYNNRICKITTAGLCYTIAGDGTSGYTGDGGAATAARVSYPAFIEVDKAGNIFFSDHSNNVIRKIDAAGIITTIAGTGTSGNTGDGGSATAATLSIPAGLCFSSSGDLYFSSQGYGVIKKITAVPITLTGTTAICNGNTTTLTSAVAGGEWSSSNTAVATVSTGGLVTSVSAGSVTISYSMSLGFGSSAITVNALPVPVIAAAGNTLSTTGTFTTYQWLLGAAPIAGATDATYTATANGSYAVSVTDANGCSGTSAAQAVFGVGINDIAAERINIYPNPVEGGRLTIQLPSQTNQSFHIVMTDMLGKKIKEMDASSNSPVTLDLNVPGGIYFLTAISETSKLQAKVVVR